VVGIYWTIGDSASSRVKLDWLAPQVIAIQFDEVEGVEEYAVVSAVVTDEIERGNAVVIAGDSFTIDDAGARAQACQRFRRSAGSDG
jgi:hypothetical protein